MPKLIQGATDAGADRAVGDCRFDRGHPAGHRPLVQAVVRALIAVRVHLFFRGTPLLIQLFLVYYGLGQFEAVRESVLWALPAQPVLVCGHHHDPAHGGLHCRDPARCHSAILPGEIEAARALGMSRFKTLVHIVMPRAARASVCRPTAMK